MCVSMMGGHRGRPWMQKIDAESDGLKLAGH